MVAGVGVHLTDLLHHFRIAPPIRPGSYGKISCESLRLEVLDISPKTCCVRLSPPSASGSELPVKGLRPSVATETEPKPLCAHLTRLGRQLPTCNR